MALCPVCGQGGEEKGACPLQPDWADEQRMGYLMSGGGDSERHEDKVSFWTSAVRHYCERSGELNVELPIVRKALSRNGNTALGLQDVMADMAARGQLLSRSEINAPPPTWAGWLLRALVVRPLSAVVGATASTPAAQGGVYVSRDVLEGLARCVAEYAANASDEPLAMVTEPGATNLAASHTVRVFLAKAAAGARLRPGESAPSSILLSVSDADAELLVSYMVATKRAAREGHVVSFAGPKPISPGDRDMLFLRCTVDQLKAETDRLQAQVDAAGAEALEHKRLGHTQQALVSMRRRKQAAQLLERRLGSLSTLKQCITKVEGMRIDKHVLDAQELAAKTMRAFREEHNLTADRVEDVISALAEEMENADEVSAAVEQMGAAVASSAGATEEQLEQGLADLEVELLAERLAEAGVVPTAVPSAAAAATVAPAAAVQAERKAALPETERAANGAGAKTAVSL